MTRSQIQRRQLQIMHGGDDRQPLLARQPAHQLEHRHLVMQVEVGRGLVEQQQPRLLRQRPRKDDPLTLAT